MAIQGKSRYTLPTISGASAPGDIELATLSVIAVDDSGGYLVGSPTYNPDGSIEVTIAAGAAAVYPDGVRILVALETDSFGTPWPVNMSPELAFGPAFHLKCDETVTGSIASGLQAGGGFASSASAQPASWAGVDQYAITGLQRDTASPNQYRSFTLTTGGSSSTAFTTNFGNRVMGALGSGGALLGVGAYGPQQLRQGRWGQVCYDNIEVRDNDVFNAATSLGAYTVGLIYITRGAATVADLTARFRPTVRAHLLDLGYT